MPCSQLHCSFHRIDFEKRNACLAQLHFKQRRITADQHDSARMPSNRLHKRREILPLAVAAQDHDQLALGPEPVEGGTVAPTLVPLLSSKYSTSSIKPTDSTRCGSPR